jgi:signal transduction histidine kinase
MVPVDAPAAARTAAVTITPARAGSPQPALALARRLHDTVVQRLSGLAYLLAAEDGGMTAEARAHCRAEIGAALAELRETLQTAAGAGPGEAAEARTLDAELAAMWDRHPRVQIEWRDPSGVLAGGAPSVLAACLAEGLRNARKHAAPEHVRVTIARDGGLLTAVVANDGAGADGGGGTGMGLRLLGIEASLLGGVVESGADAREGWWRMTLILPVAP